MRWKAQVFNVHSVPISCFPLEITRVIQGTQTPSWAVDPRSSVYCQPLWSWARQFLFFRYFLSGNLWILCIQFSAVIFLLLSLTWVQSQGQNNAKSEIYSFSSPRCKSYFMVCMQERIWWYAVFSLNHLQFFFSHTKWDCFSKSQRCCACERMVCPCLCYAWGASQRSQAGWVRQRRSRLWQQHGNYAGFELG